MLSIEQYIILEFHIAVLGGLVITPTDSVYLSGFKWHTIDDFDGVTKRCTLRTKGKVILIFCALQHTAAAHSISD